MELCQCVCGFLLKLIEMYLYVHVYVYGYLNIFVLVLVYGYACVTVYFLYVRIEGLQRKSAINLLSVWNCLETQELVQSMTL